jgi:transcriptional regulator NrdR family protein
MMCPNCGAKTKVVASRSIAKPGRGWSVSLADKVVGWYTKDFIVRRRRCTECSFSDHTVEIFTDDVRGLVKESIDGHAPEYLTTKEKR